MVFEKCIQCGSDSIYQDGLLWICPMCSHEWTEASAKELAAKAGSSKDSGSAIDSADNQVAIVKDANGAVLVDGDSITLVKELKLKGATGPLKVGTKAKNIRLTDDGNGHNIVCKIDGFGQIYLKSEFVKKN